MPRFPVSVTYNDDNRPDWMAVIKEDEGSPFQLTLTLESWDRIRLDETNIEGLLVDLSRAVTDAGLTVSDINALMTFLRVTAPRVTLVLNGTGTDLIEIIMPPGVMVRDVVRADGVRIPFTLNMARNSVSIVVTFSSIVEVQLFIQSLQVGLNVAVNTIAQTMIATAVLSKIIEEVGKIVQEVREAA